MSVYSGWGGAHAELNAAGATCCSFAELLSASTTAMCEMQIKRGKHTEILKRWHPRKPSNIATWEIQREMTQSPGMRWMRPVDSAMSALNSTKWLICSDFPAKIEKLSRGGRMMY